MVSSTVTLTEVFSYSWQLPECNSLEGGEICLQNQIVKGQGAKHVNRVCLKVLGLGKPDGITALNMAMQIELLIAGWGSNVWFFPLLWSDSA